MVKSMILRDGVESLPLDCTVELGDGEFFGHRAKHYYYSNCSLLLGCSVSKSKFIK